MSTQTSQLLEAFEALPDREKRIPFDSGPLEDEETTQAADHLFSLLDAEENDALSR